MAITYTQSNRLLDYSFGNTSFSNPTNLYVGLSTTTIGNNGTGATEPSGGSYARVQIANNKTTFGVSSNGVLTNLITVTFPESTGDWGTITYIFLSDQLTGGNILYFDPVRDASGNISPRACPSGTTIYFSASGIQISMTN